MFFRIFLHKVLKFTKTAMIEDFKFVSHDKHNCFVSEVTFVLLLVDESLIQKEWHSKVDLI